MPLIPTLRLVLLALGPLALGIVMTIDSSLLGPMLAADGALLLLALVDALLAGGRSVTVTREAPAPKISLLLRGKVWTQRCTQPGQT